MSTELAIPHSPIIVMVGDPADPEEPDFVDACPVCRDYWPCSIARLSGLDLVEEQRARESFELAMAADHDSFDAEAPF